MQRSADRRSHSMTQSESRAAQAISRSGHFKDAILNELAASYNVAQFVSCDPQLRVRFARIRGFESTTGFDSIERAAGVLLANSPERSVNVRSYDPESPESREFVYGLTSTDTIVSTVQRLAAEGLYTIANETIDVRDGGVSGVVLGDMIEFAPDDTPRAVEKPDVASLPRELGRRLLSTVYQLPLEFAFDRDDRIEFSLHPQRRGFRHEHVIIWERRRLSASGTARLAWPNRFSRLIGDKVFGLLVADAIGLPVPRTIVISRRVAPFVFGAATGSGEPWFRTSPVEQDPGFFTTLPHWTDPFELFQREDPGGSALASLLAQEGVDARWSGAAVATLSGDLIIEGVAGSGDRFMLGAMAPVEVPNAVQHRVRAVYQRAEEQIGPVRMEWVDDGRMTWVVQFHRGASISFEGTIVPGEPAHFRHFDVSDGIEKLRAAVMHAKATGDGILLVGRVGLTSHFGDILRRARVPARIKPD
jgi:hypothetical protein